jgi:PAS domain S-box-containing protein
MEKEFGISRSEELYKYITENANDLIAVFNQKIRFEFVNENVHKKILGYTKEDLLNKQLGMFIHPEDVKKVLDIIRDQSKAREGKAELRFKKKDGNYIWLEVRGGIFRNDEGKLKGITISRDITERKLADRMLKESEKKLKESEKKYRRAYDLANFYKDLFAHDMSNILQSILSTAELYTFFKDEKTRIEKLGEFSEAIRKHAIRGANLITNIRKLSKVEEIGIETQPINLQEYLNKAVENIYNTFQRKSINIKIDGLQENLIVHGDELILDIFENIMDNAVKYNNKDEVNINIKISNYQESNINYIKMEFIDNGIGIDDEKKRFIFSRIVHKDRSRRGMGIGLSLVKKIMDGYNGKVWIEDRIKGNYTQGSNFILLFQKA